MSGPIVPLSRQSLPGCEYSHTGSRYAVNKLSVNSSCKANIRLNDYRLLQKNDSRLAALPLPCWPGYGKPLISDTKEGAKAPSNAVPLWIL